jgi:shikimate dehydrogenase
VINATSSGLSDSEMPLPDSVFAPRCVAYEMVYGRDTPFMKQARAAGARVADGLGMLVEQAAEAFFVWRGVSARIRRQCSPRLSRTGQNDC